MLLLIIKNFWIRKTLKKIKVLKYLSDESEEIRKKNLNQLIILYNNIYILNNILHVNMNKLYKES